MIIYADILFLINFSMDFLILFGVGRLMHHRLRVWRLCLGAVFGGVYSVASLLIQNSIVRLLSAVAVSFILCLVAYGAVKYFKTVFLFYSGSVLLGGTVSACYSMIDSLFPDISPSANMTDIPLWLFAAVAFISVILSFVTGRLWGRGRRAENIRITVEYSGKKASLLLLCDSGNLLTEPVSGLAVIVCSRSSLFPLIGNAEPTDLEKPRVIPIKTAAGSDILYGFVPDRVLIHNKHRDCVIAIADDGTFAGCDGVIPYDLI